MATSLYELSVPTFLQNVKAGSRQYRMRHKQVEPQLRHAEVQSHDKCLVLWAGTHSPAGSVARPVGLGDIRDKDSGTRARGRAVLRVPGSRPYAVGCAQIVP